MIYRMMIRMINQEFRKTKKDRPPKTLIILLCRMIGPNRTMTHPKKVNHPGFIEKPECVGARPAEGAAPHWHADAPPCRASCFIFGTVVVAHHIMKCDRVTLFHAVAQEQYA